ncbi:4-hydroxythreonine-4-phosphate dehydrogenase PdxA [Pelagibacteraceae bacterium]|nr:4-hydroxythreonine-4-phosphate dehydrogenase PdxA [Pelagibacteraceae bacterium]
MKKKIIIISGDPNSINSELIAKSWKKLNSSVKKKIYLISNFKLIKEQFKIMKYSIPIKKVKDVETDAYSDKLKIVNVDLQFTKPFSVPTNIASKFVLNSLDLAHNLGLNKNVSGIINCAINKSLLGKHKIGVTEYLAAKCNLKNNSEVMLIRNNKFSVCPLTTHINIEDISKKITSIAIINKVKTINNWYNKCLKKKPRIGVLGLNPHNAELRKNSEEKKIIIPSIIKLKKLNINIKGPLSADTVFINEFKNYDIILGMYHDQVLGPFKALFKFNAINTTLGLKYLRVSPDHGTAVDLIGKNKANIESFLSCISFINKFGK